MRPSESFWRHARVCVVMQGDDPWFVASDVAKSLGYDNPANAINTHCKKINKITLSPDLGGREISSKMPPVVMNIIPESDVYRLVMRSNLPNAVAFQDWVCCEWQAGSGGHFAIVGRGVWEGALQCAS